MKRCSRTMLLPFAETAPAGASAARHCADSASAPLHDTTRLWLCLHVPYLPLEVRAAGNGRPRAMLAQAGQGAAVLLCDEAAHRRGVSRGMLVNAALALVPELELLGRDPLREQQVLQELAVQAGFFTPAVSIEAGSALLLEIAGSVHLFGGAARLRAQAVAMIRRHGHRVCSAVAPTARAAHWLAACDSQVLVQEYAALPGALTGLPLELPGWPEEVCRRLRRMGIRRLGECLRLPRDGLARRIGAAYLAQLDEAFGRRPEVRRMLRPAGRFHDELELPVATADGRLLMEALQILLQRLDDDLRLRQCGAWILWLRLHHLRQPPTVLRIGLLRPMADMAELAKLAALHVQGCRVPAPVTVLALEADVAALSSPVAAQLFAARPDADAAPERLLERLRARLGTGAVHGLRVCSEHRPEQAWQAVPDPQAQLHAHDAAALPTAARPLWLLEAALPLALHGGVPHFRGPLTLERGPERIESGWWDGGDIRRDYHVARTVRGERLWVFRDAGGWYLHGLFG